MLGASVIYCLEFFAPDEERVNKSRAVSGYNKSRISLNVVWHEIFFQKIVQHNLAAEPSLELSSSSSFVIAQNLPGVYVCAQDLCVRGVKSALRHTAACTSPRPIQHKK